MIKEMTPCEKLGYKVGDKFEITGGEYVGWGLGSIVELVRDDGTICPEFTGVSHKNARYEDNKMFLYVTGDKGIHVTKISKLKPAKQALADAIHKNGGWVDGTAAAIFGKKTMMCVFLMDWALPVSYNPERGSWSVISSGVIYGFKMKPFVNWHQCILSRYEYFTAYPEQVKVEVNNETEHKVEAEMKSESEMTNKVSDWHKNGELPPVGEVCEVLGTCDGKPDWGVGVIVAHTNFTDQAEIAIARHDEIFDFGWGGPEVFRPLRTERDKAIDEMVEVICDNGLLSRDGTESKRIAERLIEAGYRKEAK